jgi:hypothetical protein
MKLSVKRGYKIWQGALSTPQFCDFYGGIHPVEYWVIGARITIVESDDVFLT